MANSEQGDWLRDVGIGVTGFAKPIARVQSVFALDTVALETRIRASQDVSKLTDMQMENLPPHSSADSASLNGDSSKLVSLLTLAAGVIAVPQQADATLHYTDLNSTPAKVGFSAGYGASYHFYLPGTVQFGFKIQTFLTTFSSRFYQSVIAGRLGGIAGAQVQLNSQFIAKPFAKGDPFPSPFNGYSAGYVAWQWTFGHGPSFGYDHRYLAFRFVDTSSGNQFRYGWADVSLAIANNFGPDVTIWGYAYDDAGNQPAMGVVPEPSATSLLTLGALALGARGLRNWRRERVATQKSA